MTDIAQNQTPIPAQAAPAAPGFPPPPAAAAGPAKPAWYKRHWVHLVAVGLIGIGIGGASTGSAPTTAAPSVKTTVKTVADQGKIDEAFAKGKSAAAAELADEKSKLAAADVAQTKKFATEDAAQKKKLDAENAALQARSAQLDKREHKLTGAEAAAKANTIPGDGTFLVGKEIKAGQYKNAGGDGCYWARLSGTSGGFGDIIANGNPTGQAIVSIKSSDKAFESSGCGDWKKIG